MKRALILITLTAAIAATAAAQPGPPPPPPRDALANYLQLTDAQKSAWEAARSNFEAKVKPMHDQERAFHEQIEQALESANPDPTAIGKLMISAKQLGDQIKSAHDALDATLVSMLTPDQKAKFEAFKAARPPRGPRPGPPPMH